jgi:hypothetical protein
VQLRNVKRLGKQFSFGRQEDSHELYLSLLDAIEAVQVCCKLAAAGLVSLCLPPCAF